MKIELDLGDFEDEIAASITEAVAAGIRDFGNFRLDIRDMVRMQVVHAVNEEVARALLDVDIVSAIQMTAKKRLELAVDEMRKMGL